MDGLSDVSNYYLSGAIAVIMSGVGVGIVLDKLDRVGYD